MTSKLTTEQFSANDLHHKMLIDLNVKLYIWKDTGNTYKCDKGTIKPKNGKGLVELVDIVSKDFARKYVSLPDIMEMQINGMKSLVFAESINKEKMLQQIWSLSENHKEKFKIKVKKGKKNRSKK